MGVLGTVDISVLRQLILAHGVDHSFVVGFPEIAGPAAKVSAPASAISRNTINLRATVDFQHDVRLDSSIILRTRCDLV